MCRTHQQGTVCRQCRVIHAARIVHADLKPANFLMVEGQLKLIDFGIAKAIQGDTTSISRESQVRLALPSAKPQSLWAERLVTLCCVIASRQT